MNRKKEKITTEQLDNENAPFNGKAAKFSAFVYLGLAIAVVITATVGIFSISYDYQESVADISLPDTDISIEDISIPEITITPEDILPETPAGTEESDVEADVKPYEEQFYSPVNGKIIKGYSMDTLVYSETLGDYRVHSGVDISANVGDDVVAYTRGTVSSITEDYFYGTTVAITHDEGVVSYYMNLAPELAPNIAVGSVVDGGQAIGKVGTTARAESLDNPHLHFELRVNDALIDPKPEIP